VPFAAVLTALAIFAGPVPAPAPAPTLAPVSRAVGKPWDGRLVHGVQLPARGHGFVTWDAVRKHLRNRGWRRWGTAPLVARIERVLAAYARRHPGARPVLVGDLSRTHGGDFGAQFGGLGHVSHQNGLDADIYYPRKDRRLRGATQPSQVDRRAAQELVDAFTRAGADRVFVGPSLDLHGPPAIVTPLIHHDDHLHFRLRAGVARHAEASRRARARRAKAARRAELRRARIAPRAASSQR
jgi:murein endopeptidase